MNWIDEVHMRLKRKNKILFAKDSEYLQDLASLFQEQEHRVMALWAFEFAAETVANLEEKYPDERRPREALEAVQAWAPEKSRCVRPNKKFYPAIPLQRRSLVKKILRCVTPSGRRVRLSIRPDMRLVIPYTTLLPLFTDME